MNARELMDSVTRDMDFPRGGIEERIELDIQRHRKGWGRFVLSDPKASQSRTQNLNSRKRSTNSCSAQPLQAL